MSGIDDPLALAAGFPESSPSDWRDAVAAVLRRRGGGEVDGDPIDALTAHTYDDIAIRPLYTEQDGAALPPTGVPGAAPFVRGALDEAERRAGWDMRALHISTDARAEQFVAAETAAAQLSGGASSLWLRFPGGTAEPSAEQVAQLLDGVALQQTPVVLDAGAHTLAAARALTAVAEERGTPLTALRGSFGADPIGVRARTGAPADLAVLGELLALAPEAGLCIATVDATVAHDAGASDAQELALATSTGLAYLRTLTGAGLSLDAALNAIEFRFAVTDDQFPSIAKLRAARRLWARVAQVCGATPNRGQRQHAVTSAAMLTQRDPWTNLLRTTVACFAGAVGGADAITVLPFDLALGSPDALAFRLARNTQSVLHDEASLARVVDAAGGAWFVESLTDELARHAWTLFTQLEAAGGALAALDSGLVEELISTTRARREDDIAHRRAPITGVSEFALVSEQPLQREHLAEPADVGVLAPHRYAEAFEALRDRCDAASERPTVFLARLGAYADYSARSGFAANLFQSAGLRVLRGTVDEFTDSGAHVVCLCSSDAVYADEAEAAVAQLRAAGATQVWLAGKAQVPGVDGWLFAGCDALAVLRSTLDAAEVPA